MQKRSAKRRTMSDGHSHGDGGGCCHHGTDKARPVEEMGMEYSLYQKILLEEVECLNEAEDGSGKDCRLIRSIRHYPYQRHYKKSYKDCGIIIFQGGGCSRPGKRGETRQGRWSLTRTRNCSSTSRSRETSSSKGSSWREVGWKLAILPKHDYTLLKSLSSFLLQASPDLILQRCASSRTGHI